jgi:glycosyltransferase involved in cell wall biosynthesis
VTRHRRGTLWLLSSNRWNSAVTEYALSAALAARIAGYYVVFTPLAGSPAERRAREHGLVVSPLEHFGLTAAPAAARLAKTLQPQCLMTFGGPESFLAQLPPVRRRARVVRFRGQDKDLTGGSPLAHRWSHRAVDLVVAPSERVAEHVRNLNGDGVRVETVPLGIDATRFARVSGAASADERPQVVVLGRFDPVKGHAAALDLWRRMPVAASMKLRPQLHLVGEPANLSTAALEALVAERGLVLGNDVRITAQRIEDVPRLLSRAAVGLVPSIGSEVIGRVAEEFLLCGTPVFVSGVGSLAEVVAFEGAGRSYGGDALDDAAAWLSHWIVTSAAESETEKSARADAARAHFSLQTMAARLWPLLEER